MWGGSLTTDGGAYDTELRKKSFLGGYGRGFNARRWTRDESQIKKTEEFGAEGEGVNHRRNADEHR